MTQQLSRGLGINSNSAIVHLCHDADFSYATESATHFFVSAKLAHALDQTFLFLIEIILLCSYFGALIIMFMFNEIVAFLVCILLRGLNGNI